MGQAADVTMRKLQAAVSVSQLLGLLAGGNGSGEGLSAAERALFEGGSVEDVVERLKTRHHARLLVSSMRRVAPDAVRVLLDERDAVLTEAIRSAPGRRVVAVVGMAHMDGIERLWDRPTKRVE